MTKKKLKILLFLSALFSFTSLCFSQTNINDGSSCEKAILISDTASSIKLSSTNGATWYKLKSSSANFTIHFNNSQYNYTIYQSSNLEGSCATQNNILFSLSESTNSTIEDSIANIASALSGLCFCNTCKKGYATFFKTDIKPDYFYYIKIIGAENSFELNFEKPKTQKETKLISTKNGTKITRNEIVFIKGTCYGQLFDDNRIENEKKHMKECSGYNLYYTERNDLYVHAFKVHSYDLNSLKSKYALDSITNYLTINKEKKIHIIGYVSEGEDKLAKKYEQKSSEVLAIIVKDYLVLHKIEVERIKASGLGSAHLLYKDEKDIIESPVCTLNRNNRMEIKVVP